MNKRTLKTLEYYKILEMLSDCAATAAAKKKALSIKPLTSLYDIQRLQEETRAACLRLERYGNVSFSGISDVTGLFRLLKIGSPLSANELLDIAALLEAADEVQAFGMKQSDDTDDKIEKRDILSESFEMLDPARHISSEIRRVILGPGEIADDASSALQSIRRELRMADERLHIKLDKIMKSESNREMLREVIITQRNGRYCLPVKSEHRAHFPGMVHDQSRGGSTLFIEPLEIVNFNNQIKELEAQEAIEIERILEELSTLAGSAHEVIESDYSILTKLDFIFAKARLAGKMDACEPIFNEDGIIDIKKGVHPLLNKSTAVPVDIKLGEDYSLLIVTGPKTGGKTVSLKTLGLLTLMGQSGLHVPAAYGTKLSVFKNVFADIGDEQSIEQNLSTFSSHMSNIIYIVKHAGPDSLCLFDEPGGGTDPVEGSALAIAILRYLRDNGSIVMATTHYSELKTFAVSEDGVMNASFEFDVENMQPTYKLLPGVPGSSNAFAISGKLGLPKDIIDSARDGIDKNALLMENAITMLEEARVEALHDKEEIEAMKKEIEELKTSLSQKEARLSDDRKRLIEEARAEAREILENAKEEADRSIREYNKWLKNPKTANAAQMEKKRAALREQINSLSNKNEPKKASGFSPEDFHIGDSVHVISLDTDGNVISGPDSKGMITVEMGILSSRFPADDLFIIPDDVSDTKENNTPKRNVAYKSFGKAGNFSPEINLLGKTVDEATAALDKFLDDALLSHAESVRIVHGKGTGALRKGIHEYLKRQRFIKEFKLAEFGDGDAGVTIVTFK